MEPLLSTHVSPMGCTELGKCYGQQGTFSPLCHLHANYTKACPRDMLEKDALLRSAAPWRTEEGWGCLQLPLASQLDAPVQWTDCSTEHTSPGGAPKLGGICFKPNPNFPRNMLEGRSWQYTICRLSELGKDSTESKVS